MIELEDLKGDIKLYLGLTGGPSVNLCGALIKTVDFLDDFIAGRDPAQEMSRLSLSLLITMATAALERTAVMPGVTGPVRQLMKGLDWARTHDDVKLACDVLRANLLTLLRVANLRPDDSAYSL